MSNRRRKYGSVPGGLIPLIPKDDAGMIWEARQPAPRFGDIVEIDELATVLGVVREDFDPAYRPEIVTILENIVGAIFKSIFQYRFFMIDMRIGLRVLFKLSVFMDTEYSHCYQP
jgi:hypothetical protein